MAGAGRDADDERDGVAAGAGAVENVWTGAAAGAVEPENTCCPVAVVTVPDEPRGAVVARGAVAARGAVVLPLERAGAVARRSAEAGAWLRATFGVLNCGDGRVACCCCCCAGALVAGADGCAGVGAAAAGATTRKDAGAKPPVAFEAVIV